ncbi:MAG TPA: nuclear transport factor 2 family protein [Solirubrobacteraceae bacterium]|nr:nuclear transport factor 2 family protein [Solirubrobacteraceae bacterium]
MFSWLAAAVLRRNMARLNAGDHRPLLRLYARDVRFRFPGDSTWATELEGREELGRWLQRFVEAGLHIEADEVLAQGPPWNMRICVRGVDHLDTEDGRVYENRYVIWGRMAWGLMRDYEVYEDTQASKALDGYLQRRGEAAGTPSG